MTKDTITAKVEEFASKFSVVMNSNGELATDFLRESLTEIATLARKEGREESVRVALEWIETYAPRICTNDATGNGRPMEADMLVSPSLVQQAWDKALEALTN